MLEDFWGRRNSAPRYERDFTLFGRPARLRSNDAAALEALEASLPLFSTAAVTHHAPFTIQIVFRAAPESPGALPENLSAITRYTGDGSWLSIQMGAWGHCHIDLARGSAIAVLEPALAERPDLISRHLLNTILTNLVIGSGFAMLHCTGLARNGRVLLLMAPHNSGKSTTAMRLVLGGYQLLSDSQIYVSPDSEALELLGFPVGKLKLRRDMLGHFPDLAPFLVAEQVRDETKFSLELRRFKPALVHESALRPLSVDLCLLTRGESRETRLTPASHDEAISAAVENSIFYDTPAVWENNMSLIERCLAGARCHHLVVGRDPSGIVATINALFGATSA